MTTIGTAADWSERERQRLLSRCRRSLWFLLTEILPWGAAVGLTEQFHKPMLDDWDVRRRVRMRARRAGEVAPIPRLEGEAWPREYGKTTCRKGQVIQDYLWDPCERHCWWHAVEERAQESGVDIGRQMQTNRDLRRLMGESAPPSLSHGKKWASASGFTMPARHGSGIQSFRAWGAGSEATGGHGRVGIVDDPIGLNDVEDNLMPVKRRWVSATVMNVIEGREGEVRATFTRWDMDDLYSDWLSSPSWLIRVRAVYESVGEDGVPRPDRNGAPVFWTREQIEQKWRAMDSEYLASCQLMNDPLPVGSRGWVQATCEHDRIGLEDAMRGPGRIFVLTDPAPKGPGSLSGVKEQERQDGTGDWWSTAVGRLRLHGQRLQAVLLGGSHSRSWSSSDGFEECARLMRYWNTNMLFCETYGGLGADYTDEALRVCRGAGVRLYLEQSGDRWRLPRFVDSHASGAKNMRIERLCDWAKRGDFLICETVPAEFLGGQEHEDLFGHQGRDIGFLAQIRKFRALPKGRNNLKFDDDVDAVARLTDQRLQEFAPRPELGQEAGRDPWGDPLVAAEVAVVRSRYCGI